jgi:hypothetical protein
VLCKEAECKKCGIVGHYAACSKTKPSWVKQERFNEKKGKGNMKSVKNVDGDKKRDSASDDSNSEEKSELAFQVTSLHVHKVSSSEDSVEVSVGSVPVKVLINSDATVIVIEKMEWDILKKVKVKCVSYLTNEKLYVCGSKEPLSVLGAFRADVSINNRIVQDVEFMMLSGSAV